MEEEGWAKEDLHQLRIKIEKEVCLGRSAASRTQKHWFVFYFLTFNAPRTQQTLLLQCFFVFIISEHQNIIILIPFYFFCFQSTTNSIFQCFPVFSASRKQQTLFSSMLSCFLCSLCIPSTPPSPTLPLDLARKHKKQEDIDEIEFVVFWKQKKQENIVIITLFVF